METLELEIYGRYRTLVEKSGAFSGRTCPDGEPARVHLGDIIDRYDAFCFDGYGTLYNRGDFVYPGAKEWFSELRRMGKQIRLVTNAASNLDKALADEADARGFDFTVEETISSGSLLKGGSLLYWPFNGCECTLRMRDCGGRESRDAGGGGVVFDGDRRDVRAGGIYLAPARGAIAGAESRCLGPAY